MNKLYTVRFVNKKYGYTVCVYNRWNIEDALEIMGRYEPYWQFEKIFEDESRIVWEGV